MGGRQIPAEGGNIYDHIEVNYLWSDGARSFIAHRQIDNCKNENNCCLLGTRGQAKLLRSQPEIVSPQPWRYEGEKPYMYQFEQNEFFRSIRQGAPINDGDRMVNSTLTAIMGRMAAYTGAEVTWEMALNSEDRLVPPTLDWDTPVEFRPRALPGLTPLL
jgi:hypothetical protein